MARSAEAKNLLRQLDAELADASAAAGHSLVWSAAEAATIRAIASTIDRKCDLVRDYLKADGPSARVALSAEIRLLETQLTRLLKQVSTEVPAPMSNVSRKAKAAANTRWEKERHRAQTS